MTKSNSNMRQGLLWNYVSIVILSLSGLVFNALIIHFYGAKALGIFNQVYAYYIVFSQLCVWGIHMSILQCIPLLTDNKKESRAALGTAIILVVLLSGILCLVLYVITGKSSTDVVKSFNYVLPALVIFSVNKVILNFFNGMLHMRLYAILQSIRCIAIAIGIVFLAIKGVNEIQLSFCFLIGEVIVVLLGVVMLIWCKMFPLFFSVNWAKKHLKFGNKILLANMVLEMNTKIDIICMGWILKDDYQIGIYSFAVLFAEGFYQVFVVIRRSMNPIITQVYQDINKRCESLSNITKDINKWIIFLRWLGVPLIGVGYFLLCHIMNKQEYLEGIVPLLIVCLFIAVNAKSIIYGNFFAQIGKPSTESLINVVTVTINFIGNMILISLFGVNGAAIATGISYLGFALLLRYFVKKKENIII